MDFDLFLEEASKRVKKKKLKIKSVSSKKKKELMEKIILDDECTTVPQTDSGRRTYK